MHASSDGELSVPAPCLHGSDSLSEVCCPSRHPLAGEGAVWSLVWRPLPSRRESGGRDPQTVGSDRFSRDPGPQDRLRSPAQDGGSQDTGRSWAALRSAVPGGRFGPVAAPRAVDSELARGSLPRGASLNLSLLFRNPRVLTRVSLWGRVSGVTAVNSSL